MKIAIDTGHTLTGADTGAEGNGYKEQNCTREIGNILKSLFESLGHTVLMVAVDTAATIGQSLSARVDKANAAGVDLFISIHLNAGGGNGTEVYVHSLNADNSIPIRIIKEFNGIGFPTHNGGIHNENLYVTSHTNMYSMLVECCYIDSSDMLKYNPQKFAECICKGVVGKLPDSNTVDTTFTGWKQWQDGRWSYFITGYMLKSVWVKDSKGFLYLDNEGKNIINGSAADSKGIAEIKDSYFTGQYLK